MFDGEDYRSGMKQHYDNKNKSQNKNPRNSEEDDLIHGEKDINDDEDLYDLEDGHIYSEMFRKNNWDPF